MAQLRNQCLCVMWTCGKKQTCFWFIVTFFCDKIKDGVTFSINKQKLQNRKLCVFILFLCFGLASVEVEFHSITSDFFPIFLLSLAH